MEGVRSKVDQPLIYLKCLKKIQRDSKIVWVICGLSHFATEESAKIPIQKY